MTLKEKKERINIIVELMEKEYPDAVCSLVADDPFHLLVATRLSAQCTDARVNICRTPHSRSLCECHY